MKTLLYGRPLKHIRHVDEDFITLEPQRFFLHTFWKTTSVAGGSTSRTDGLDLKDEKKAPSGSIVTKHKMEILVTPETIEPQQIYMGRVKLSFHDIHAEPINGVTIDQTAYQGATTKTSITTAITPHLYSNDDGGFIVEGDEATNQEIGGAASGFGIKEWMLDDNIKHFINLKKITVFDQRPLMGERWQRIPAKVKRFNPYSYYGLFLFNDSVRGGTPADTQVKFNIKSYWEELAI